MQVAEILVRRTIRFLFFFGEGKKGPAAKEKSSKVENKEKKRGKKNIPRRSQRVRDFLSLSLSLSLSLIFFVIFLPSLLFSASSKISCAKKKEKRERDFWLAADDQWGAWIFFLLGFFICRRGKLLFVLFFFRFPFIFQRRLGLAVGDVAKPIRSLVSLGVFYGLGQWNCVNNERPSKEQLDQTKKLGTFVSTSGANDFQSRPRWRRETR